MISRIHSKLGTAGLVVAIVALVVALTGVAVAASGLNGKQKKEVKSIAKQFAGKNGAPGAPGPKGDTGATGPAGKDGSNGTNGAPGQSVTGTPIATGNACGPQTGVKYTLGATSTNVCNGETGFTETLPSGKTETGAWGYGIVNHANIQRVPVSFNIPLEAAPTVHVINASGLEKEFPSGTEVEQPACPGTFAEPAADPGVLCLYTDSAFGGETNVLFAGYPPLTHSYTTGAVIAILPTEATTESSSYGTWAVTAP